MPTDSFTTQTGGSVEFAISEVMMQLGTFQFSISTAAYDELARVSSYSWPEQSVIGSEPAMQFTGKEAETIALRGVIYPTASFAFFPMQQIPELRGMAEAGTAYSLTSGTGKNLGRWVIEQISERGSRHFTDGTPRKIEFDLNLKRYSLK
jgi:uncharacterized protein